MNSTPRKVLLRSPTIVTDPTGQTYSRRAAERARRLERDVKRGGTTTLGSSDGVDQHERRACAPRPCA